MMTMTAADAAIITAAANKTKASLLIEGSLF